jgi:RNA polymerase sigma-70 factor, ECF subfamily
MRGARHSFAQASPRGEDQGNLLPFSCASKLARSSGGEPWAPGVTRSASVLVELFTGPYHRATVTEDQIVTGCQRGDRQAQRALYELTSERVYRVLLRILGNPEDAFDVAQDAYLLIFARIGQFGGQSRLTTWVHRIAVNEALQSLRKRRVRERTLEAARQESGSGNNDPRHTADARLDVEAALLRLPEAERVLIVLRYFEGMDYDEMSRVLEKPPGTIASGLNRARQALRTLLGDSPEDSRPGEGKAPRPHLSG